MSKKSILLLALAGGIIHFLMELLRLKLKFSEIGLELYSSIIIIIGLGIGFWASKKSAKDTKQQVVRKVNLEELTNEYNLSTREKEVLQELLAGKSNQEIAEILFISVATVKTHVSNILSKTDYSRRTQLISALNDKLQISLKVENEKSS